MKKIILVLTLAAGLGINEQGCWGNAETATTTAPKEALTPEFALAKIKELAAADIGRHATFSLERKNALKVIITQPDSTLDVVAETLFLAKDLTTELESERKDFLETKATLMENINENNYPFLKKLIAPILMCKNEDAMGPISGEFYSLLNQPPQAPAPAVTVAAAAPAAAGAAAAAPAAAASTPFYGLLNGRNICYFNALMQALAALDAKDRFNDKITPLLQILSGQTVLENLTSINLPSSSEDRLANASQFDAKLYLGRLLNPDIDKEHDPMRLNQLLRQAIDEKKYDSAEFFENSILGCLPSEGVEKKDVPFRFHSKDNLLYFSAHVTFFQKNRDEIENKIEEKKPQVVIMHFGQDPTSKVQTPKQDDTFVDVDTMLTLRVQDSIYQLKSILYFDEKIAHYTACVLRDGNWYYCNDGYVHTKESNGFPRKEALEKMIYMLFYEKIDPATAPQVSAPGSVPVISDIVETDPLAPLKQAILEDFQRRANVTQEVLDEISKSIFKKSEAEGMLSEAKNLYLSYETNAPFFELKLAILQYFYKYTTTGSGLTKEAISNILEANTVEELLEKRIELMEKNQTKDDDVILRDEILNKTNKSDVVLLIEILQTESKEILQIIDEGLPPPAPAQ